MSKPFVFEKPIGMRDTLPTLLKKKSDIMSRVQHTVQQWGYEPIETPMLEFYDTVGGVSATLEQKLFKLLDRSGRSLVLRPDMTAPIARVVGSLLRDHPFPLRLSYQGHVFRAQEKEAGRNAEFPEVGVEYIGEEAPDADAEVIALAISALKAAGVPNFTLTIGHAGFITALFKQCLDHDEQEKTLKQSLYDKDYVGYRRAVNNMALTSEKKEALLSLLTHHGSTDILKQVRGMIKSADLDQVIQEIEELWTVLEDYNVTQYLKLDFSLMREMDYYTGVHFEIYAQNLGFPIGNGGRYDHLLSQFGRPAPAIGFSLKVDRILEVSTVETRSENKRVVITYTSKERQKAVALAERLREENHTVILHRMKNDHTPVSVEADERIALEQEEGSQ
ncbi:ATP phosphoribosyltransferase regulatory subunit [Caldalkalibacillus salinus]|uniref:ATP phosphoribosyltransferase regulatory subunit n=1 Tax=Caldalkalibacillus salinus TaxID=2803787 RepID=UPI001922A160|nr:ATP phosphoribosyltransferase regulatory subunit [Caldalkalibacillus salinus]